MTSHSDSRDFSCQYCEKTYKYKKGVNRHVKKFHNLTVSENRKTFRKKFKVEDYLDLGDQEKFIPKRIIDKSTGKEVEMIFTWHHRGVKVE